MARLASNMLDAKLVRHPPARPALQRKLSGIFASPQASAPTCLLICQSPADLNSVVSIPELRRYHGRIVAWVFDSFWTSMIPQWVRFSRIFLCIFVTEKEVVDIWRQRIPAPIEWLPWGSDALKLGSSRADRSLDLLRFGRQPAEWDNDELSEVKCRLLGLSFHGRPESFTDPEENQRALMSLLGDTKLALAFSNRVSPSVQTHPSREYITGRWTDALAAGATVAGIPSRSESISTLLWPEALLPLETVDQDEGLAVIASAVRGWEPARARLNHLRSLERLDWRWRFSRLAEVLEVRSERLDNELRLLRDSIHSLQ
jgi:hypothetical protein